MPKPPRRRALERIAARVREKISTERRVELVARAKRAARAAGGRAGEGRP